MNILNILILCASSYSLQNKKAVNIIKKFLENKDYIFNPKPDKIQIFYMGRNILYHLKDDYKTVSNNNLNKYYYMHDNDKITLDGYNPIHYENIIIPDNINNILEQKINRLQEYVGFNTFDIIIDEVCPLEKNINAVDPAPLYNLINSTLSKDGIFLISNLKEKHIIRKTRPKYLFGFEIVFDYLLQITNDNFMTENNNLKYRYYIWKRRFPDHKLPNLKYKRCIRKS